MVMQINADSTQNRSGLTRMTPINAEDAGGDQRGGTSSEDNGADQRSNSRKSASRFIINIVVLLLVAFAVPQVLSVILKTETPMVAITSNSMWPALKRGDIVVMRGVTPDNVQVEDIVVYANDQGFIIHRVTEISREMIITKGDANTFQDKPVEFGQLIGKAVEYGDKKPVRIPFVGYLSILVNGE